MFDLPKDQRPVTEADKQELAKVAQEWARQLQNSPLVTIIKTYENFQKKTADSLNRMFEPLKLATDRLTKFPSVNLTIGSVRGYQEILQEEQNLILVELLELKKQEVKTQAKPYYYNRQTGAVIINVPTIDAFNLSDSYENNNVEVLFEICWEALEDHGKVSGNCEEVPLTRKEIKKEAESKGKQDIDHYWITNTRNNLNKKLKKRSEFLSISTLDKNIDSYWFRRKIINNKTSNAAIMTALQREN